LIYNRAPALFVLSSAVWAAESRTTGLLWEGISMQNTVIVADGKNTTLRNIFCVTLETETKQKQIQKKKHTRNLFWNKVRLYPMRVHNTLYN